MREGSVETRIYDAVTGQLADGAGTVAEAAKVALQAGRNSQEHPEREGFVDAMLFLAREKANNVTRRVVNYVGPRWLRETTAIL